MHTEDVVEFHYPGKREGCEYDIPESFVPKTELGAKLWEIKKRMILNGECTQEWNEVLSIIRDARYGRDVDDDGL